MIQIYPLNNILTVAAELLARGITQREMAIFLGF